MHLTYFGVLWLIINCFMMTRSYKAQFFLLLFSCTLQANTIITHSEFTYGVPALAVAVFIDLRYILTSREDVFLVCRKRDSYLKWLWIFFGFSSFITLFSAGFLNKGTLVFTSKIWKTASWYHLSLSFRALFLIGTYSAYMFAAYVIMNTCDDISEKDLIHIVEVISIFVLAIGGIQFFEKYFKLNFPLMKYFIYSNELNNCYYDPVLRFYSTFLEPSYTAVFFAALFWFRAIQTDKYNVLITIGLLGGMFISLGMTGYGAFCVGALAFLFLNRDNKVLIILLSIAILAASALLLSGYALVIYKQLMSKGGSFVRFAWNRLALELVKETKGIGVGFGVARANSLIINILVKTGIIGLILYIAARIIEFKNLIPLCKRNTVFKGLFLYSLTIFAGQVIADPDLEFEIFWFGVFLYAMTVHNKEFTGELTDAKPSFFNYHSILQQQ